MPERLLGLLLLIVGLQLACSVDFNPDRPWESRVSFRTTTTPAPGPAQKTRSLNGGSATDGNNETNADVMKLITVGLLDGYAIRRVKSFNNRVYLTRYRRSYWLGTRYYETDNFYYLATRDSCIYRMNATERKDLEYEDGEQILDVVYQCQRYAQYCCGLNCCNIRKKRSLSKFDKNSAERVAEFKSLLLSFFLPFLMLFFNMQTYSS